MTVTCHFLKVDHNEKTPTLVVRLDGFDSPLRLVPETVEDAEIVVGISDQLEANARHAATMARFAAMHDRTVKSLRGGG